jgi:hypothetical protein
MPAKQLAEYTKLCFKLSMCDFFARKVVATVSPRSRVCRRWAHRRDNRLLFETIVNLTKRIGLLPLTSEGTQKSKNQIRFF